MAEYPNSMRNKGYTETEEEFLKSCAKLALERNITNAEVARFISPLLDRTPKGVEQKMGFVKQDLLLEEKKRRWMYEDEMAEVNRFVQQEESKKQTDFGSNSIQTLDKERQPKQAALPPLDASDIGKRLKVRVYNVKPYGAFCETEDGKTGLIIKGFVSTDFVENVEDYLRVGDVFEALVVEDRQNPGKSLLNAKALGNIIAISERGN